MNNNSYITNTIYTAFVLLLIHAELNKMTSKELLYVEDALGHEQYFQTQFCESAEKIQDQELREFARQLSRQHKSIFMNFYGLL